MPYSSYMVPSMLCAKNQPVPVPTTVRNCTAHFQLNLLAYT